MVSSRALFEAVLKYKWFFIPLGFACLNALLWTAFASFGGNPVLHGDSAEAYAWGREFQFGYYKHPPFWAWIAGLWFSVFPHKDWAFFLLSELNASLGVLGAWALMGRFTKGPERLAGTLLLFLTTFYTLNAFRFNANTAQLSIWPWTMYFFLLSIEKKTIKSGIIFGILTGIAMLSKYYTALLLLTCFIASLVHRDRRDYYRSFAPWAAFSVYLIVISPHLVWLVQHNYQPFAYAFEQSVYQKPKFAYTWIGLLTSCLLYHVVQVGIILISKFRQKIPNTVDIKHGRPVLFVLALAPVILTLIIRLIGYRATPLYVIPIFSLTPFLILLLVKADAKRVIRLCAWVYGIVMTACLIASPVVPYITARTNEPLKPIEQAASVAVDEWNKTIQAPLRLVSGTQPYSESLAFYAPKGASEFIDFNPKYAPWVTEKRIEEQGMLVICLTGDRLCLDRAEPYKNAKTKIVEKEVPPKWGPSTGQKISFTLIMIPPKGTVPEAASM